MNHILQTLLDEKRQVILNQFYHYTQVTFCYNSNHIEGSQLSEFQTGYIFEYNEIPTQDSQIIKVNDVIEARNHFRAFDFIIDSAESELDSTYLKDLHAIIKNNSTNTGIIGDFKTKQNFVGNLKTTPPHLVKKHINNLLQSYNTRQNIGFNDIIDFHFQIDFKRK